MTRSVVCGFGSALPRRVVTNEELQKLVDTSDSWIQQRTGIKQRYIAGEGETTASLGEAAARAALANAGLNPDDIDPSPACHNLLSPRHIPTQNI